jgi:uncharacterized membrane protein (DUF485 family)
MSDLSKPGDQSVSQSNIRKKAVIDFGLFAVFFVFYMTAAIIQTPLGKNIAVVPVMGIPFGLLMSIAIFPVSWIIITIWYLKAR